MIIKTSNINSIKPFFKKLILPQSNSHKGQNGRIMVVGGSSLFHAASIWAAEVASHFVDIVHYSSTKENNEIMLSLKKKFLNGIVVPKEQIEEYVREDDCTLVGPGMLRKIRNPKSEIRNNSQNPNIKFQNLLSIKDEAEYTFFLTKYLIENFPEKKFVFDAGVLQMMDSQWLMKLKTQAIITPHQIEFERLFNIPVLQEKSVENKAKIVKETAKQHRCIILLKAIVDIISDGNQTIIVEGGNQGLTKGGTGDVLAGLVTSFYAKSPALESAVFSSFLLKWAADELSNNKGYWYNIREIISHIPVALKNITNRI